MPCAHPRNRGHAGSIPHPPHGLSDPASAHGLSDPAEARRRMGPEVSQKEPARRPCTAPKRRMTGRLGRRISEPVILLRMLTGDGPPADRQMTMTLRLDKDFPLDEWIALYRISDYNRGWGERNARAALAYAYLVTTGWLEGRSVGTLTVWFDGVNFAWLDDLVVHPGYRHRGIGTRLVTDPPAARLGGDLCRASAARPWALAVLRRTWLCHPGGRKGHGPRHRQRSLTASLRMTLRRPLPPAMPQRQAIGKPRPAW